MSSSEHILSIAKLRELDALYEKTEDMGVLRRRPTEWGTSVEELREIRRLVEGGTKVRIEGTETVLKVVARFLQLGSRSLSRA